MTPSPFRRRGRCLIPLIIFVLLFAAAVLLYVRREEVLAWPGAFLIKTDPLVRADAVIVLAGGASGERILEAAKLVKDGYAPLVLVSGPMNWYESSECDPAIAMAVRHGYKRDFFQCVPHHAKSTKEEAPVLLAAARQRGARTVLVVTSEFHTRRARTIFRQFGAGLEIRLIAAKSPYFQMDTWYRDREARKIVFLEWAKTLTAPFGI